MFSRIPFSNHHSIHTGALILCQFIQSTQKTNKSRQWHKKLILLLLSKTFTLIRQRRMQYFQSKKKDKVDLLSLKKTNWASTVREFYKNKMSWWMCKERICLQERCRAQITFARFMVNLQSFLKKKVVSSIWTNLIKMLIHRQKRLSSAQLVQR